MSSQRELVEVCVLCCRDIDYFATARCDHPVCYECSTRMLVFGKQRECPICRRAIPLVLFTHNEVLYTTLASSQPLMNKEYNIVFEDDEIREAFERLLENKCKSCDIVFKNFRQLKMHMGNVHELHYCDICVEHLSIFPFEQKCYTKSDLVRHGRSGDPDQTSHRGHPRCEFCQKRYVDNDTLFSHLRVDHFFCSFCDAEGKNQFYSDLNYLKTHLRKDHYLCEEGECQEQQYVAFISQIDFQVHKATYHFKHKSKAEAKQARTLDLEFPITPRTSSNGGSPQQSSRYGRQNQQRKRNIDDNMNRENISFAQQDNQMRNEIKQEIDMESVQEFPHLPGGLASYSSSKNGVLPENSTSTFIQPYGRQFAPGKFNNEEFPALSSTSLQNNYQMPPSFSRDVVQNQNPSWPKPKPWISASQDSLGSAMNMSKNSVYSQKIVRKKNSMPPFQVESSDLEDSMTKSLPPNWTTKKTPVSFEENFPKLATKNKPAIQGTWTKPEKMCAPPPPSQKCDSVAFQVASKPKSKKKKEKQALIAGDNDAKTSKPFVVKADTLPASASWGESAVNKTKVENQENEDPSSAMLQIVKNLVSYSAVEEKSKNADDFRSSQPPKLLSDDFPPLPTVDTTVRVPPGFHANQKAPPPGFSVKSSLGASSLINMSLSSVAQQLTMSKKGKCFNGAAESLKENGSYTYQQPPEFRKRNDDLRRQITDSFRGQEQLFDKFKHTSVQFRQNYISATDYHSECLGILGKDEFLCVISELIALLPDISKQQQLLAVHNSFLQRESKMQGAVPKRNGLNNVPKTQLEVCPICQQVLVNTDFKSHHSDHDYQFCDASS